MTPTGSSRQLHSTTMPHKLALLTVALVVPAHISYLIYILNTHRLLATVHVQHNEPCGQPEASSPTSCTVRNFKFPLHSQHLLVENESFLLFWYKSVAANGQEGPRFDYMW